MATLSFLVGEGDTATALGSGDVPVLATPRLIAWMEAAAVEAVDLGAGETSVGVHLDVQHLAATAVGGEVMCRAEVIERDGRMISFAVEAAEGDKVIASGTHRRAVVDRQRFLDRL